MVSLFLKGRIYVCSILILVCRQVCQYRMREERRKVERIMEALPKRTLKKKDESPVESAASTDQRR